MPTALVTGPTAGIGRAFARAYARRGFDLVLVSRDQARLWQVAEELVREYGVAAEVLPADLSNPEDLGRVADRMQDPARPVGALVNNAGFGLGRRFHESPYSEQERSLDVMVRAPLRLCHAALGPMLERGRGEIVNVSSIAAFLPRGTYGAHKAWLTSLSEWMRLTYRPHGIRVLALCPGFVRTEFHQRANIDTSRIPRWMWLDADELVEQALRDLAAGKAVSVPSRRYRSLAAAARLAPRPVVARADGIRR